jgi:cytochrome c2
MALLFLGLIGLSSCTGMFRRGTTDGGMMMDREGMKAIMQGMMGDVLPPGIDPALLPEPQSQGALLLARYCSQCHNLPGPGTHTAEELFESPDESELQAILRYLQEYAQKPIDEAQYDDLDTSAGRAFQSTCSLCHALPDPQQHTSEEWPAVVERMRQHMVTQGKAVPNEATMGEIVGFLQRHAKTPE